MRLEKLHSVDEIAEAWRKSVQFVRREIHAGRLQAVRLGVELRVSEASLQEYLEANMSDGPAECRDPRRRKWPRERDKESPVDSPSESTG